MIAVIVCLCIGSCYCTAVGRKDEGLTDVPTDIPIDVSWLDLTGNNITALGDCEFCLYTQLLRLFLTSNSISVISSSAFQHTALVSLYLNGNQLVVVPDLHFIAETLERLLLNDNQITSISPTAFDDCTALENLRLNGNPLTTVPRLNISVETLSYLDVSSEHLVCDTRLLWLKDMAQRGVTVVGFTCAAPPSLQGRSFNDLTREELALVGKSQRVHDVGKRADARFSCDVSEVK